MLDKFKTIFNKKPQIEETVAEPQTLVQPSVVESQPEILPKPKKFRKKKQSNTNSARTKKSAKPKKKKDTVNKEKLLATKNNEPYISILRVDIDPDNINNGSFELDWNDKFVLDLIRAGYKIKDTDTDNDIVDRWFQTVCRNVALEVFEQDMADPEKRRNETVRVIHQRDLGNGRTEVS